MITEKYNGAKMYTPEGLPTFEYIEVKDEWGCSTKKRVSNAKFTRNYMKYCKITKPLSDMRKEYYTLKHSCQYQLAHYGDIDVIQVQRLAYLKKQIIEILNSLTSVDIQDAIEFLGYKEDR